MIKLCREGSKELFIIIKEKYKLSISRDKSFSKYVDHIGKIYFEIEPPKGMGGLLSSLLKSFGGGEIV